MIKNRQELYKILKKDKNYNIPQWPKQNTNPRLTTSRLPTSRLPTSRLHLANISLTNISLTNISPCLLALKIYAKNTDTNISPTRQTHSPRSITRPSKRVIHQRGTTTKVQSNKSKNRIEFFITYINFYRILKKDKMRQIAKSCIRFQKKIK